MEGKASAYAKNQSTYQSIFSECHEAGISPISIALSHASLEPSVMYTT